MSFVIRNLTGSAIVLDDLGITLAASADRDVTDLQPQDVALSADLVASIASGDIAVLSPLDGVTVLGIADSTEVVQAHNDPHWGIRAGTLDQLDDVDLTGQAPGDVLQLSGGNYQPVTPSALAGDINLGDLNDVDDGTGHTAGTIYLFKGDGTNLDVVDSTDADFLEVIQDIAGGMGVNGTDTTFTYNDGAGTMEWSVDDVFLRNTGDTLDSGTLTIASGATLAVATGGTLTIADAPVNPTDATNKAYVDSLAAGLDPKESVRYGTVSDPGGTYNSSGGTGGTGEFTAIDLTASGPFDGLTGGAIQVGDRILIKNAASNLQNGIYVVTTAGAAGVIERAPDHDGSPSNEVSGGNFTFVEEGTTLASTGWVLQGDGELTLNTDPIVWVQFSESTDIQTGIGLATGGNVFDLDVDNLSAVASGIDAANDTIAFHDADGAAEASGSQSRKITFQNLFNDLNVVNGITTNGIVVRTADDTYASRTIVAAGAGALDGLDVTNGDGVSGNPTVGLDINGMVARSDAVDGTDRVAVYNITSGANEYYTVAELAGAAGASDSFVTWAGAGNTSGDASIVADSPTDTATLSGGIGINTDFTAATDIIELSFTRAGMADTAVAGTDTFPFFDASNVNEPEFRSFNDMITDLGLATAAWTTVTGDSGTASADSSADTLSFVGATNGGITTTVTDDPEVVTFGITGVDLAVFGGTLATTDFVIVNDSADAVTDLSTRITWANVISDLNITTGGVESVTASADEDELGITVGGTATDPTVGLDIVGQTDPDDDMDATDEFIVHDKSEGTGGANRKMTGQNIADGVLAISGLDGLAVTTIGGQEILTLVDTTRSNKVLSIQETAMTWSENRIGNNDWLQIGNANDADSGYIVPLNATIVRVTAHTENDNNNTKDIDLYIDAANQGAIATFTAVNGENEDSDVTLNIDVTAGQKLRLRGGATGGSVEDTVVTIWLKWRG